MLGGILFIPPLHSILFIRHHGNDHGHDKGNKKYHTNN